MYARHYVETRGWFVLPLHSVNPGGTCTCPDHLKCKHRGKHPHGKFAPHGIRDATRMACAVMAWWEHYPWMNIGIVVGPSGLAVLDIDPRNGGNESLQDLVSRFGPLPTTLTVDTGGGGQHFYFSDPDRVIQSTKLAPGLDLLAAGRLVVATPSLHTSGRRYEWRNADETIVEPPGWFPRSPGHGRH